MRISIRGKEGHCCKGPTKEQAVEEQSGLVTYMHAYIHTSKTLHGGAFPHAELRPGYPIVNTVHSEMCINHPHNICLYIVYLSLSSWPDYVALDQHLLVAQQTASIGVRCTIVRCSGNRGCVAEGEEFSDLHVGKDEHTIAPIAHAYLVANTELRMTTVTQSSVSSIHGSV